MPQKRGNLANNAPRWVADKGLTGEQLFNAVPVGVVHITTAEASAAGNLPGPGWYLRHVGSGSIDSISVTAGGTAYANTDTVSVTGGSAPATGTVVTNASGVITAVTLGAPGKGFSSSANASITTTTGSGATLTAKIGGRGGRTSMELLVASRNMVD